MYEPDQANFLKRRDARLASTTLQPQLPDDFSSGLRSSFVYEAAGLNEGHRVTLSQIHLEEIHRTCLKYRGQPPSQSTNQADL